MVGWKNILKKPQKSNELIPKNCHGLKGPVTFSKAHHFGALHVVFMLVFRSVNSGIFPSFYNHQPCEVKGWTSLVSTTSSKSIFVTGSKTRFFVVAVFGRFISPQICHETLSTTSSHLSTANERLDGC